MIRKALPTDFEYIKSLFFHPNINPFLLYEMDEQAYFASIFEDLLSKQTLFVFETNGQAAGMFKLVPLAHRTDHIAYLGSVAIHPDFAGRGLGLLMMDEMLDYSKQRGFLRIELSTATTNHKAIRLYEKAGFQKEGILRNYTHLKSEKRFLDEVLMAYIKVSR